MPKLEAKYVPIGTEVLETKNANSGKSIKELEAEAKAKNTRVGTLGNEQEKVQEEKPQLGITPLVKLKEENKPTPLVAIKQTKVEPLVNVEKPTPTPLVPIKEEKPHALIDIKEEKPALPDFEQQAIEAELEKQRQQEEELRKFNEELFDSNFINFLKNIEYEVEEGIKSGDIKLIVTNADRNMLNIKDAFDAATADVVENVNYDIIDEKKVAYTQELSSVAKRLEKLELSIDHETYQNELKISEMEDNMLRQTRYRKRKLEGLDDIGGIEGIDHKTEEQQEAIDVKRNTDFTGGSSERRTGREEGYVERRAFSQDYAGSDLEGIDTERDRLEQEILQKQEAEAKKNKKNRKKKTEEEKIAEAKERLRQKQEKRKAKQEKRTKVDDVAEIDLVGNQFDVEELREEKMDRLLEIKKLSAEKKELQKQKEKQRSKATKEFYKYKKVNKKSHIVGFKQ